MSYCTICLEKNRPLYNNICEYCRELSNDILNGYCDIHTILNTCEFCKKTRRIDEGFMLSRYHKTFICKFCYTNFHYKTFGYENTCMICLESDLISIKEHMNTCHWCIFDTINCKYCNKKIVECKKFYIKHYCVIPIKNKYMNINIL